MPITILPPYLSSQISAGEIIERPASVVKEIIENSIDAGAKNISIEIEKSGFQSMVFKDDGCGIHKKELLLAIARHATSKITTLSDLNKISTFGFRGEALASIRAVSRLTLISSYCSNDISWKIYSEGFYNNKDIILQPIAHPLGTTVIVENLFYNIPVRLIFIKNKKLEFVKICEVFRQIALSHFDINFSLKHNKKLIMQYDAIKNENDKINRLQDVFNKINIKKMIEIKSKKYNFLLFGWISCPYFFQTSENIKYVFINKRCIRNNLILNAIRCAYSSIQEYKNISFILYLKIPYDNISINIHPTKNEIKFHNSDQVYHFIYEAILCNLKKLKSKIVLNNTLFNIHDFSLYKKNKLNDLESFYLKFLTLTSEYFSKKKNREKSIKKKQNNFLSYDTSLKKYSCCFGRLLIITRQYYGLIYYHDDFLLISFPLSKGIIRKKKLIRNIERKIVPERLLINIKINLTKKEYTIFVENKEILLKFGFHFILKKECIILDAIPYFFQKKNIEVLISKFFLFLLLKKKVLISDVTDWFYNNIFIELKNWNYENGISVLLDLEYYYPFFLKNPSPKILQKININTALCMLKI